MSDDFKSIGSVIGSTLDKQAIRLPEQQISEGEQAEGDYVPSRVARIMDEKSKDILFNQYDDDDIRFNHSFFCQLGLPRSARHLKGARVFTSKCGDAHMRIEAGAFFNGKEFIEQPLPTGAKPRLILVHICSEAVRTRSPKINLFDSINEFLKKLGMDNSGRGYKLFKQQMIALSAAKLQLGFKMGNEVYSLSTNPIEAFKMWLSDDGAQEALWPGELMLSDPFFDSLIEHAVPLDMRALSALADSPLAIDLYCWLAQRLRRLDSKGQYLKWSNLQGQFGQGYKDVKDFKKQFKIALQRSLSVYPFARVKFVTGGVYLNESHPPIRENKIFLTS